MANVRKLIYEKIKDQIATIPDIRFFDFWNSNVIRDGEVTPYPTPAVFYEYLGGSYDDPRSSTGIEDCSDKFPAQDGVIEFALHIIISKNRADSEDADELYHYDVYNLIYSSVNFLKIPESVFPFYRTSDSVSNSHGVLRDFVINFRATIIDDGATNLGGSIVDANEVVVGGVKPALDIYYNPKPFINI